MTLTTEATEAIAFTFIMGWFTAAAVGFIIAIVAWRKGLE